MRAANYDDVLDEVYKLQADADIDFYKDVKLGIDTLYKIDPQLNNPEENFIEKYQR